MGLDEEIRAAGRLVGDVLAGGVGAVRDVHRAVAHRTFRAVGPVADPVRLLHDGISALVYATVGAAHAVIPRAGAAVAAQVAPPDATPLGQRRVATLALGAVNGLWGDRMSTSYPALAPPMAVRSRAGQHAGRDVPLTGEGLRQAYPDATGRLAVFLHGLCETEDWWRMYSRRHYGDDTTSYGSLLRRDLGYTPVYLRYNTGERISRTGRRLSAVLESLVDGWPVPVTGIALIGHSMGGLVARSACHYGQADGQRWTRAVAHVCCLGSPHLGAPLEKGATVAAWFLARLPETRPAARILNLRSVGIRDLGHGAVVDEDWRDVDADEYPRDRCTRVPLLPHAAHYFVGVTLTRRPDHPVGVLVGDLMVRLPSAAGRGAHRRVPFEAGTGRHVGALHHLDLLNHPAIYSQLHAWLSAGAGA